MFRLGDNGDGSGEKMNVEIIGNGVKLNKLFGHSTTRDGNSNLTMTITFVIEQASHSRGIRAVCTKTVAGFGRIDD